MSSTRFSRQLRHGVPGRHLAPADGDISVEGEEAGRRPRLHDLPEVPPVPFARALSIGGADAAIHAPAAIAGAVLAEQVLQRGPQVGRERADRELHFFAQSISLCTAPGYLDTR